MPPLAASASPSRTLPMASQRRNPAFFSWLGVTMYLTREANVASLRAIAQYLRGVGFELEEDLDDFQIVERYDPHGLNGLQPASQSRIARARVIATGEQRAGA